MSTATATGGPLVPAGAFGCAALMIAQAVASRATRDTLFLSNFNIAHLPMMVAGASALSIAVALLASRAMVSQGPARVIPVGFAVSAVLTLGERWLASVNTGAAAIAVYLHVATLGPVLISGFWSIVNERFDPRTAKRAVGRIAGVGTLGGLMGGLVAERITAWSGVSNTLIALAVLHAGCAWLLSGLARSAHGSRRRAGEEATLSAAQAGRGLITTSYIRNLALLIFGTSVSAVLLDFVFKSQTLGVARQSLELMRVFSAFYTIVAVLTFAIQTLLTRLALERVGLPSTIGSLPASVVVGGVVAAALPGPWSIGIARGLEAVLRGSLFRSSYELLYTPIPPAEKRATKTLVDVGCDRLGEAIGAGLTVATLAVVPGHQNLALIVLAVLIAFATLGVVFRLQLGYVSSLEAGLRAGALDLDRLEVEDVTTRSTLLRSFSGHEMGTLRQSAPSLFESLSGFRSPLAASEPAESTEAAGPGPDDPITHAMRELRSGNPERVQRLLAGTPHLDPALVPEAIQLLARDDVAREAFLALQRVSARHVGQLVDALLDPGGDFVIRRRIPGVLVETRDPRVIAGLTQGLSDERFEVRFRCGRALARMLEAGSDLKIDRDRILSAIHREATIGQKVWESQRLLDKLEDGSGEGFVDEFLRERAGRSLEHVFTLLSLVLPREPLRIAFRGLYAGDPLLRGTALEYLESVLPVPIRDVLWPYLDTDGVSRRKTASAPRERQEVLQDLLRSNQSIEISLDALRELRRGQGPAGETPGE